MSIVIRPFGLDEMESIQAIDRSVEQTAEYLVEPTPDAVGLMLKRRPLLAPVPMAGWAAGELAARLEQWRTLVKNGATAIGAYEDERMVGMALLGKTLFDTTAELHAFFIASRYRQGPAAEKLLAAVEDQARRQDAGAISLFITLTSAQAIDFYLDSGFRVIGLQDTSRVKHKGWELRLAKTVAPPAGNGK
jgi:ribosomal protein S18 acetylase RimI-like enzyme